MSSAQLFLYGFVVICFMFLNKFEASQTYICAIENQEDKVTRITCPSGSIISDIRFASYGNPEGSCGNYTVGSCHAPNSMNIVANECLNQTTCSLLSSHAIFDFNECHDEALQLYAEALCSDFSTSPIVHSSGEELTVNVRDESTIEGMDTSASYIYPLATVTPTVCMTSNYGAISGSWIVCQVDATTAWISAATSSGGTYQADLICNYLGYSNVTAQGGTCGTVCGYCSNGGAGCGTTSTAGYYFDGGGGSVSSLSITVHWVCGNPIPTYLPTLSPMSPTVIPSILPSIIPTLSPTSPTVIPSTINPSIVPSTISPTVGCRSGWTYYNNKCYNFNVGTGYSWSTCQSQCISLSASMLCIPDSTTNSWIANQMYYYYNYYYSWIGYSDSSNTGYEWVSGCYSSYTNWNYNSYYYYYDYAYMYASSGSWYATSDTTYSSVTCSCEYYLGPTSSPTLPPTSPTVIPSTVPSTISPTVGCRSGWIIYNNKCYNFNVGTGYSWSTCQSKCTSLSASMLCITDSTTNSWIAYQIYYYYYNNYHSWIGYSDSTNTGYKWVSGCSSSYKNWNSNSYYNNYDYAYMSANSGNWYATSDTTSKSSVTCNCEYNLGSTSLVGPTLAPTTISCQSGWTKYNNKCYKFNVLTNYDSWSGCKSECASLDSIMLCITDSTTNDWISNKIYGIDYSWIGYSDYPSNNNKYYWVSGCSSSYTNWNYYSYYYNYHYAYMKISDGSWYATSISESNVIGCSCEYSLSSTTSSSSSSSSSSVAVTIIIIIAVVLFCIFSIYVYFVKSRNNARIDIDESNQIEVSSNQEYGNGNIAHTFPVTKINQEYGNISPSFPVASSNHGFPVATNVSNEGYANISPSYPVTNSSNQEYGYGNNATSYPAAPNSIQGYANSSPSYPVTSSYNQEYGHGNISPSYPVTSSSSNQEYGYGNNATSYPAVPSSSQGYGNISSSLPATSNYNQNYGNISYSIPETGSNQEYGYGNVPSSYPVTNSSSNQEYGSLPATSNYNQNYGNISYSIPETGSNQEYGYGNVPSSYPVTNSSSNQEYGSLPATSNYNQNYGNISYSTPETGSNQEYGYGNVPSSYHDTSNYNQGYGNISHTF